MVAFVVVVAAAVVVALAAVAVLVVLRGRAAVAAVVDDTADTDSAGTATAVAATASSDKAAGSKSKPKSKGHGKGKGPAEPLHSWCAAVLKGHTGTITAVAFTPDDKLLGTCALDRSVRLWPSAEWRAGKKDHSSRRINIDLDEPTAMHFSPDSKALLVGLGTSLKARVIKLGKSSTSTVLEFPDGKAITTADFVGVGIAGAERHKYMMTAYGDTALAIWSLKGELLKKVDTKLMSNTHAAVSPTGRFVGVSGFTPEVHIWEVVTSGGSDIECAEVMNLTGHTAGVYHFAFSLDSRRAVSVSKDGTWRMYDIDVRYQAREDCHLLASGRYASFADSAVVAVAPDGNTVVVCSGGSVQVFPTQGPNAGKCAQEIKQSAGTITGVLFDAASDYFVVSAGKQVQVYLNVVGLRQRLVSLQKQIKQTDHATVRERLQAQAKAIEASLPTK
eukprot:m.11700 g.11700  ORF g.11700 m.11700 type:complete len:446 (+) comp4086_c0_seq1:220-1557(+)